MTSARIASRAPRASTRAGSSLLRLAAWGLWALAGQGCGLGIFDGLSGGAGSSPDSGLDSGVPEERCEADASCVGEETDAATDAPSPDEASGDTGGDLTDALDGAS